MDLLESAFMDPLQLEEDLKSSPISLKLVMNAIALLNAFSIAVGFYILTIPATKLVWIGILFSVIGNFVLFLLLPKVFGPILDSLAQKKDRPGKAFESIAASAISSSIFMLYTPIATISQALGGRGGLYGLIILLFLLFCYAFILARNVQYIYELKSQDSIRFTLRALSYTFLIPLTFFIYISVNLPAILSL